ncbi:glycosyl transferase [Synechococcus sp. RedBA-s]|nr:glycosyl transferase [Synechococcus sp. RedBA-s]
MMAPSLMGLATVALAALLSAGLLGLLLPLLLRLLPDHPNARSAHGQATPRGGGVAFVLVGVLWGLPITPLLCTPLALVGLFDDRYDLPSGLRYLAQLLTAMALLAAAALPVVSGGWLGVLAGLVIVVAITATINFVNFMDGLDGLVASCLAVFLTVAALSLGAAWLWPLVGALLGFLAWNWNPARVFMGDVGSTFLGAVMASVVLQEPNWSKALGLLLVATPLLGDAVICVVRRWWAGHSLFQAHRLHLYQRLHRAGVSPRRIAVGYASATALLGVVFLVGGTMAVMILAVLLASLGIYLDQAKALHFRES